MKRYAILAIGLSFTVASLSLNVIAADQPSATKQGDTHENGQPKTMKKHSHMEDKGLPSSDRTSTGKSTKADGQSANTDKSKHLHPRDGK